jgi:prevent-host-death family protein
MNMARVAELKNNLSRYLSYVREGGEVLILDRDTPVARLVPFAAGHEIRAEGLAAEEQLGQMERQGLISRGNPAAVREWLESRRPLPVPAGTRSLLETLLEMRAEDSR